MNETAWCYLEGYGCKKDKVRIRLVGPDHLYHTLTLAICGAYPRVILSIFVCLGSTIRWDASRKLRVSGFQRLQVGREDGARRRGH